VLKDMVILRENSSKGDFILSNEEIKSKLFALCVRISICYIFQPYSLLICIFILYFHFHMCIYCVFIVYFLCFSFYILYPVNDSMIIIIQVCLGP